MPEPWTRHADCDAPFQMNGSIIASITSAGVLLGLAGVAQAGEPAPPRHGFQMAIRTGYTLPFGKFDAQPDDGLSNAFSGQVPIIFDIGGKIGSHVFLGGYFGFGFGGTGNLLRPACDSAGATCAAVTIRTGVEALYYFLPERLVDPWIGYGIGYEGTGAGISVPDRPELTFVGRGIEFAHLLGGFDFRLSRTFGLGPFVDFSLGEYINAHIDVGTGEAVDGHIDSKAMHEWLSLGVRGVFFP